MAMLASKTQESGKGIKEYETASTEILPPHPVA